MKYLHYSSITAVTFLPQVWSLAELGDLGLVSQEEDVLEEEDQLGCSSRTLVGMV